MAFKINHDICEALLESTQDESLLKVPQEICEGLLAVPQDCDGLTLEDCESLFVSCGECDSLLNYKEEGNESVSKCGKCFTTI